MSKAEELEERLKNYSLETLGMILATNPSFANEINNLINEDKQLLKIFISSVKTAKDNKK